MNDNMSDYKGLIHLMEATPQALTTNYKAVANVTKQHESNASA